MLINVIVYGILFTKGTKTHISETVKRSSQLFYY